jgi:guanylate kinase
MSEIDNRDKTRGKVVIVSGPSGVGKSTICREVVRRLGDVYLSVSVTTRPRGPGEQNGKDYWFISEEEFRRRIDEGMLLEYAEVFGNLYGTPTEKVEEALQAGKVVILEIDVQGARQARSVYRDAVMIFILPPTEKDLAERMGRRGRDKPDAAEVRLSGASNEIAAAWQYYDNMVINEDLEQAVGEVLHIIRQAPVSREPSARNDGQVGEQ